MVDSRRHITLFAVLCGLIASGCGEIDYRPSAIGNDSEIVIVTDDQYWQGEIGDALRETLSDYVETLPAPEREFELRRMNMQTSFEGIQQQKNVVIVAPYTDSSAVGRFLRSRLPEDAVGAQDGVAVHREDLWRRNQMIVYMTAATPEALAQTIRDNGEDILYLFNRITRKRVTEDIFEKGRQRNVEEYLMEKHGFAVNVQHDFRIAIDTTNFVWLRRILSDTWRSIFVYYIEDANPAVLSPEWIYATRDSLTKQWIQGNAGGFVKIDRPPRRPLETDLVNFLDRYGFETRGLWQMVGEREDGSLFQFGAGGPFVTYTFYDEPSGRIYMIDGMVFAPGYEKRDFLRHMEAIAYTFRTQVQAAPVEARAHGRRSSGRKEGSQKKRVLPAQAH